jgi:outer membrane protein with beta-barrel domain
MKPQLNLIKKTLLLLTISIGSVLTLTAQEQRTGSEGHITPKFGIKAGLNLSNLYVDNVQDENIKLGLNVGLLAKIPFVRGLSIQPELLYTSKGAKLIYDNFLQGKGEYRFNLNYVELPVLAVINLAKKFNLHAGGYLAYLASANIKDMNEDGTVTAIKDFNADNFNRIDYGLIGGLGIDVENFTIGARYNYGLREVGEAGSGGASGYTQNSKNSVITLYLGLGF